ncbi:MAG TPA: trypsin-like serine protease, partial [Candidatus Omnitrophota bacterium]|nr:trypsin-like serine protease [Candidatus Omnitrophota bacterium]
SDILNNTISSGKIISLGTTTINNKREIELIKINMNMYNGDSGGPILSRDGKLIGIMMGKFEKQDRSALAVPSNKIKKLYLEFLKNRYNTPK